VQRLIDGNSDLWLMDIARPVPRRFTSDAATDTYPIWSPDSTRLAFGSARLHGSVVHDLFVRSVNGIDTEMPVLESGENKNPLDWSRDGRYIVYGVLNAKTGPDLWVLPMDGTRKPFPYVETPANETGAAFSPDGRRIAYSSNETGRNEIYVQPFPGPARSTLVSTAGGTRPVWSEDGREIYYRGLDNRVMAMSVSFSGDRVSAGAPVALFALRPNATFMVDPSGKRFLVNTTLETESAPPITVVLNWRPAR
jgi:Tol biopolymer transport system component